MLQQRKKRLTLILLPLAGVEVAATLVVSAPHQNISLFYTPSEIALGRAPFLERNTNDSPGISPA